MNRPTLIVMLKEPRPGRVKTRLARDIGKTAAANWFRHQSQALLRNLSQDPRWNIVASVSPDPAIHSRVWPPTLSRIPQGSGDLGERMRRALVQCSPGPTVLIGGDIPGVSKSHINRAFTLLKRRDVVLGPATDGGFWLIGVKGAKPLPTALFQNVRWSSKHTLQDTMKSIGTGHSIGLTDTLSDVDTLQDLLDQKKLDHI